MGKIFSGGGKHTCSFCDVICVENLLLAWEEFRKGKRSKADTARFELSLEDNLFDLHQRLVSMVWKPDPYQMFFVNDPKLRKIHKATVRDRVLYQAVYRVLYQVFDQTFIFHSYASRDYKGTHAGVASFEKYVRQISKNYTDVGYVVKCDIRKFFDSIDHAILLDLIKQKVKDSKLILLIENIIYSFSTVLGKGLPLGNVTSQLFANIYMNQLDQYLKRELKAKCYVRYCDDFVIVSGSRRYLDYCVRKIGRFCLKELKLDLHPRKIIFRKIHQGIDFLGYVALPHRRVLRTKTKRRILGKIGKLKLLNDAGLVQEKFIEQSVQSYLGILSHCRSEKVREQIERIFYD